MTFEMIRFVRGSALCAMALLAGCGILPSSGPSKSQIYAGSVLREGDAFIITVTDRVNQIASSRRALGFSDRLRNAGLLSADVIRPGDKLELLIWENVENGLLSSATGGPSGLSGIEVDDNGNIFVPYAGRIHAAGKNPDAIRRIITEKLAEQTPDPQVQVMRAEGEGASVTLMGGGVLPITRTMRRLSQAISGSEISKPSGTRISLTRGTVTESIFMNDLLRDPRLDIALRNGDRIQVEQDQRAFSVLGAAGGQSELKFGRDAISAMEALAQVGGLSPTRADPTGVFVLRNEPEEITESLTGTDVTGTQRVVYVLDLTVPNGLFMARDFAIRDKDTIYVTEAPIVQFSNIIASLTGGLNNVNSLTSTVSATTGRR